MSDSDQKPSEGQITKDFEVDKPGIVGARWWHHSLMDEDAKIQRRKVLIGLGVAGGAVAAISALGIGIVKLASGEKTALASRKALDMQRQFGWDFGARGVPLVFDGVAEGPFVREELQSLAKVMAPSGQGPNGKYFVGTLIGSLYAAPIATLPDPEDGQAAPDSAPFRRLAEILVPIATPAMARAYKAGEALARVTGFRQEVAVLADLPGPEAVAFAAGAASAFEPVLLLDNWPHPHAVVPSHLTLAALAYYQPRFAAQRERLVSAPLFVLDRSRFNPYSEESDRFDNRYHARMPRLSLLAKDGVRALLYVAASPADVVELPDVHPVLSEPAAANEPGVEVRALALTDFADPGAGQSGKLYYGGSARAEARFWDDYAFGRTQDAAPPAESAATKDYRFAPRPGTQAAPLPSLGTVAVVATASGLVLAAALDRRRTFERYAAGWRQGSMNRFSSGSGG